MIILKAEKRIETNLRILREKNIVPAILYGPKAENINIQVDLVEFERTYRKTGDSLLITLKVEDKEYLVLVRDTQFAPMSGNPIHIDFYLAPLKEKIEVEVPVVFSGESLAVKNLGGSLTKNITELPVRAFPQSLPKQIDISLDVLKEFDDKVVVRDLKDVGDFEVMRDPGDVIVSINRPGAIMEGGFEEEEKEEKKEEGDDKKVEENKKGETKAK